MGGAIAWLFCGVLAVFLVPRLVDMWRSGARVEAAGIAGALVVVPVLLALTA